jgi:hypothetical protein
MNHTHWHSIHTVIPSHWLSITHHDSHKPRSDVLCWAVVVNLCEFCWASGCETLCPMLIWVCGNYGMLCWAMGFESLCVMLNSICGNHWDLCWASCCESLCVMLSRICANHGMLSWASGFESFCVMPQHSILWFPHTPISIAHNDSQPLAQHISKWLSQWFVNHGVLCCTSAPESWKVILNQWLCIIVSYAEPVVENHVLFYWASGCESWSVMLCQWFWIMLCNNDSPWFTTIGKA